MFFRKTERKKHSVGVILTIGALAAIGAVTVTNCSKQIVNDMVRKVKTMFKKEDCSCPIEKEC